MKRTVLADFLKLRFLIGFLGEKGQYGWWQTSFVSASSAMFLAPTFPRTTLSAQYHGITEAARRIHDDHIGIGKVYHLFRLPEEIEQDLHTTLTEGKSLFPMEICANRDTALAELVKVASGSISAPEGPVKIGEAKDILSSETITKLARHYAVAFSVGTKNYPYFTL